MKEEDLGSFDLVDTGVGFGVTVTVTGGEGEGGAELVDIEALACCKELEVVLKKLELHC